MCADFYHEQVVAELVVSNEELEYDIVKEALQGGVGQPKENNKDHHQGHNDRLDIIKLGDIILVQEDTIKEL